MLHEEINFSYYIDINHCLCEAIGCVWCSEYDSDGYSTFIDNKNAL